MKENKDLRKKLKNAFETPDTPFEEWAEKQCVYKELEELGCPVYECAENVNGRGVRSVNKKKTTVISIVAAFIIVAIILSCVLPWILRPRVYGEVDTVNVDIELDEIKAKKDIYLFDLSTIAKIESVDKYMLKSNSKIMLYGIYNCLLSVENNDGADGFYITYRIRTYEYFEFVGNQQYNELKSTLNINNIKINYRIDYVDDSSVAYAKFTVGKYDYFIETYGYEEVTVLDEDNFINLLNKIIL